MIKAELRKLRALPATPAMIEAAAQKIEYDEQYGYGCAVRTKHVVTNKYHRMVRIQQLGAYQDRGILSKVAAKGDPNTDL